jgi:hypothetical protein
LAFGSGAMNACAKAAARAATPARAAPRAFQRSAMFTYVFPGEAERAQRSPGLFVQPLRYGLRVGAVSELGPGWWGMRCDPPCQTRAVPSSWPKYLQKVCGHARVTAPTASPASGRVSRQHPPSVQGRSVPAPLQMCRRGDVSSA